MPLAPAGDRPLRCFAACGPRESAISVKAGDATRQRRAWAAAARPHCDSVSLKRFATADFDLGRLKMRCLRHAARQPLATQRDGCVTHKVKGIRNISSSDSTKMDARTEFEADDVSGIVHRSSHARRAA